MLHILAHATFKAALFMSAGIVDHETHTRDIRRLGGLRRLMPLTFAIAAIAGLSMAGLSAAERVPVEGTDAGETPPMIWPTHLDGGRAGHGGRGLSVGYSLRLPGACLPWPGARDYPHQPHDPRPGLWAAPAFLASLVVVSGLVPMATFGPLVDAAALGHAPATSVAKIAIGTGWKRPRCGCRWPAIGGGLMLLGRLSRLRALRDRAPRPEAKAIFDAAWSGHLPQMPAVTEALHNMLAPWHAGPGGFW
jgi:multicomponent K+:H+ antiporter subunit A